jgi:exodeoxyribonuclease V alpha subunit
VSPVLEQLRAAGVLRALDVSIAQRLIELCPPQDEGVELAIALLSRHVGEGHVCLPLDELANGTLADRLEVAPDSWPQRSTPAWDQLLRGSPLTTGSAASPLVLDEAGRLYFRRYFEHERALAAQVRARGALEESALDETQLESGLHRHFGADDPADLQRLAAETALRRRLTLISGGPGTGKTSTVVKILALLNEQAQARGQDFPRMKLMAPTGKAAMRLMEAIRGAKGKLQSMAAVRDHIPNEVTTIHRALLEVTRLRNADALERARPLAADVVLVDESSMVDLTLMARLFEAVPQSARIILLGDKDQLASVEAGAVLGDLCAAGLAKGAEPRARAREAGVVQLTRSYRYAETSGIAMLARAIQGADAGRAMDILRDPRFPDVTWRPELPERELGAELSAQVIAGYTPYLELARVEPELALKKFDQFRVLCAHRRGPLGVEVINRQIAQLLFDRNLLARPDGRCPGWPLLVTNNDYRNRLWNGDLGLIAHDASRPSATCAYFLTPDGDARMLSVGRLPRHESAFALSVHKSQGSEIDDVAVVLPREVSPVVTRELLYTAVTRARFRVTVYASEALLEAAVKRSVARSSGLLSLLS